MSTGAAVIVKLADGSYQGIYSYSDGYGLLPFLKVMAPTQEQAEQLVALGDCSQIYACERIKPIGKHSWDVREKRTVIAYHRDRNEVWNDVKPIDGKTWLSVARRISHSGYAYVFEDGRWSMYKSGGYGCNKFVPVTPQVVETA